jgi:hypothetical protein
LLCVGLLLLSIVLSGLVSLTVRELWIAPFGLAIVVRRRAVRFVVVESR